MPLELYKDRKPVCQGVFAQSCEVLHVISSMVTLRCYVLNRRFLDNVTVIIFARCTEILATDKRRYIYMYMF